MVGFDLPIKGLTIHVYTKAILLKNCLNSHSCHFVKKKFNQTPSWICSMCPYCIGKVSNCSIKRCDRSWSAHEGTIYAYTKALLGKFSQFSFCQKNVINQTPLCICSKCLHCIGKVSNDSIKSCGRSWSAHEGTIDVYTKALLGKNFLIILSKIIFFLIKLLHAYVQCVYIVQAKYQMAPSNAVVGVDWPMQRINLLHQKLW